MVAAKVFVLLTVVVLGLLSLQAEPVTAVMGWVLAGVYMLALIAQTLKGK
jgi:hypothetical protein